MAAMRASGLRLCQMVQDTSLQHGIVDHLELVHISASYNSQLDKMIIDSINKFTIVKKLTDDIAILLQYMRPGSSFPATLMGLYGENHFQALVALRLPANAKKNVHLEVEIVARHLALQAFIDLHIHVYEVFIYIGVYKAREDTTMLAFISRLEALDAFVQKHLDLATKVAAPQPLVGGPTH